MLNWAQISEPSILLFALILLRMSAFIFSSAVFGQTNIPHHVKILLALVISVVLFSTVKNSAPLAQFSEDLILVVVREVAVGLCLGFLTRLFFMTVGMVGDLVSMSMGLSNAQLFNPISNSQSNALEQYHNILGILVLLGMNGHHMFLEAIAQSYQVIPVGYLSLNLASFAEVAHIVQTILLLTLKMAAPVVVAMLVTNVGMAILGRAVPQINVLVTSVPVQVLLGLIVLIVCMPLWILEMNGVLDATTTKLFEVMKAL